MSDNKLPTLQSLASKVKERCLVCIIGAFILVLIAVISIFLILRSGGPSSGDDAEQITQASLDAIVQHGQIKLTEMRNKGEDLSLGPCLDNNETFEGWVIDIAHEPRTEADDDLDNQCSAYKRGSATNFIELSETGDIIRIYPPRNAE